MTMNVKDGGNWKMVNGLFVRDAGLWVPVRTGYVLTGGNWEEFYNGELVVIAPTSVTSAEVRDLFEAVEAGVWSSNTRKRLIVNSSRGPLSVSSEWGGDLSIEVTSSGVVGGVGGAAGGAGGNAISVTAGTGCAILNEGVIQGGGGGGGTGGTGGGGSYGITVYEPSSGWYEVINSYWVKELKNNSQNDWYWGGSGVATTFGATTTVTVGAVTYYRGNRFTFDGVYNYYGIRRTYPSTVNTNGGAGGAGGAGEGVNQTKTNGVNGAAGGTNAGTGGKGGDGGSYGAAGSTGATGSAGNRTSGAAGYAGGASGKAINGYNRCVYSGDGTLAGGTAST